jgi:hypothetical protein
MTRQAPAPPSASRPSQPGRPGRASAQLALVVGVLYAAVSAYWAVGGTWLLNTVGGGLESAGRAREVPIIALLWAVVLLKLVAAALPGVALDPPPGSGAGLSHLVRPVGWLVGGVLAAYGLVLTSAGLLVETGVLHAGRGADHRALAYHAFLWDPWFLIWGFLMLTALRRSRGRGTQRRAGEPA